MSFLWIGSANQYAKGLALRTQWTLKKQSGDYTGHKRSLQDYVTFTRASELRGHEDERDDKLSAIVTKAQMGRKLSPDEWEYLKAKNPTLYAKLRDIEKEQKQYEEALKRCKTRDEAQRLHVSKLAEVMAEAKNGDEGALIRLNRLTQTMTAFTESATYHRMPTEGEQAVERESERKAELEALRQKAALREAECEEGRTDSSLGSAVDADAGEARPPEEPSGDRFPAAEEHRPILRGEGERGGPKPEAGDPPAREAFPSAVPFGRQAYLDEQSGKTRSRRRIVDAEA